MNEKLIHRLRNPGWAIGASQDAANIMREAADALEELSTRPEEAATAWKAVGYYDKLHDRVKWEPGREPPHDALLYRPHTPQNGEESK